MCVSDYGRSQLMAIVEPEQWPKISVVHCGVDTNRSRSRPAQSRNGRPLRILNVGRLVSVKGQAVLLEAVANVRRRGLDVVVTIVGDGPLRDSLREAARDLGVQDIVEFTGSVGQDDIAAHYRNADLFCLPSLREGVPVVLMEAMAERRAGDRQPDNGHPRARRGRRHRAARATRTRRRAGGRDRSRWPATRT